METVEEGNEFVFQDCFFLVQLTGRKAGNVRELLKEIEKIDAQSLFYHFYHSMLKFDFSEREYYNDFSYWLYQVLHEGSLAEKIAAPYVWEYNDIEDIRAYLISLLDDHLSRHKKSYTPPKPEINAFHFKKAVAIVVPTKYQATDLEEFLACLKEVEVDIIFYHFIASRLRLGQEQGKYRDDFSRWVAESVGDTDLANKMIALDPLGFSLEGMRDKLVSLVEKSLKKKEAA